MINQQLLDFIKQQLQLGLTKEKITSDLLSNGWNAQDIEEGFRVISIPTSPSIPITNNVIYENESTAKKTLFFFLRKMPFLVSMFVGLIFLFLVYFICAITNNLGPSLLPPLIFFGFFFIPPIVITFGIFLVGNKKRWSFQNTEKGFQHTVPIISVFFMILFFLCFAVIFSLFPKDSENLSILFVESILGIVVIIFIGAIVFKIFHNKKDLKTEVMIPILKPENIQNSEKLNALKMYPPWNFIIIAVFSLISALLSMFYLLNVSEVFSSYSRKTTLGIFLCSSIIFAILDLKYHNFIKKRLSHGINNDKYISNVLYLLGCCNIFILILVFIAFSYTGYTGFL